MGWHGMRNPVFVTGEVGGHEQIALRVRSPWNGWRPRHFVYGGEAKTFKIIDLFVGKQAQFLKLRGESFFTYPRDTSDGVSADLFKSFPSSLLSAIELVSLSAEKAENGQEIQRLLVGLTEKIDNLPCLDEAMVEMEVTMVVRNLVPFRATFNGILYGEVRWPEGGSVAEALARRFEAPSPPVQHEIIRHRLPDPESLVNPARGQVRSLRQCELCKGNGATESGTCGTCKGSGNVPGDLLEVRDE